MGVPSGSAPAAPFVVWSPTSQYRRSAGPPAFECAWAILLPIWPWKSEHVVPRSYSETYVDIVAACFGDLAHLERPPVIPSVVEPRAGAALMCASAPPPPIPAHDEYALTV